MIAFKNVSVVFTSDGQEHRAVDNVSLEIQTGEFFGIVGFSGAGKSTLVRTVNLLQRPTEGGVFIDGVEVNSLKGDELCALRQSVGMIFQHFNLITNASIRDNIAFALKSSHTRKQEIDKRVDELLEVVGIRDKKHQYPSDLSGGQQQRVAIARALANNPKILLCDEATSALDPQTTKEIVQLLKEIKRQYPLTVLFITHQMDVAKSLFDKIAVMSQGRIVEVNDTYNIFAHPRQEQTKSMVKHALYLDIPREAIEKDVTDNNARHLFLIFKPEYAYEGIIAHVVKNFNVDISILAGKIEYILGKPLGILAISVTGGDADRSKALDYLNEKTFVHEFGLEDL